MRGAFKKKKKKKEYKCSLTSEDGDGVCVWGAVKGGEKGMERERASMCVCLCVLANL